MVNGRRVCPWQPIVSRYADDFLVLHEDRTVIERCRQSATAWLADRGLELKPSKTRITHTLRETGGNVGFDFLGFTVRQHPVGKTYSGKNTIGEPLGYKTIITPSNEAVQRHTHAMSSVIRAHKGANQAALIGPLNPVIRGWVNYYATVVSKRVFSKLDAITYAQLRSWARHRHSGKSGLWVARKYGQFDQGRWTFGTTDGYTLAKHLDLRNHGRVHAGKAQRQTDPAAHEGRRDEEPLHWRVGLLGRTTWPTPRTADRGGDAPQEATGEMRQVWAVRPQRGHTRERPYPPRRQRRGRGAF